MKNHLLALNRWFNISMKELFCHKQDAEGIRAAMARNGAGRAGDVDLFEKILCLYRFVHRLDILLVCARMGDEVYVN